MGLVFGLSHQSLAAEECMVSLFIGRRRFWNHLCDLDLRLNSFHTLRSMALFVWWSAQEAGRR